MSSQLGSKVTIRPSFSPFKLIPKTIVEQKSVLLHNKLIIPVLYPACNSDSRFSSTSAHSTQINRLLPRSRDSIIRPLDLPRGKVLGVSSFCSQVICPPKVPSNSQNLTVLKERSARMAKIVHLFEKSEVPSHLNGTSQRIDIPSVVAASTSCLLNNGVIAVPTDTIYGVACLAQSSDAIRRIYEIKGRNHEKPIAISVGEIDNIYRWSKVVVPRELLTDLLPGPVTVVFERLSDLNPELNPHTHLVGVRIPKHDFMQNLAKACKGPIALTSANISGSASCLQIQEFDCLWQKLDLVVDGGTLHDTEESRQGSTVVDLSVPGTYLIIRPGSAHLPTVRCLEDKYNLKDRSSQVSPER